MLKTIDFSQLVMVTGGDNNNGGGIFPGSGPGFHQDVITNAPWASQNVTINNFNNGIDPACARSKVCMSRMNHGSQPTRQEPVRHGW